MARLAIVDAPLDSSGAGRAERQRPVVQRGVSVADFNPDRDLDGSDAVRIVDALEALWA